MGLYNIYGTTFRWTQWWSFQSEYGGASKVLVDQMAWDPAWNNLYILILGTMKLGSLDSMVDGTKRTTVPLITLGFKVRGIAHSITYGLVPVENRLLWVDIVEILWVSILATSAANASAAHCNAVSPLDVEAETGPSHNEATTTGPS